MVEGSGNNLKGGHFFNNGAFYLRGLVVYRKGETGNGRESYTLAKCIQER